jgi:hypothetical protein
VSPLFLWRYFADRGIQAGESEQFATREEAEDWMGVAWSDLHSSGVEAAALEDMDRGRILYRMGLRAE